MSNGKVLIFNLIVGLIKKRLHKMSQYFLQLSKTFGVNINVKMICLIMQQKQI